MKNNLIVPCAALAALVASPAAHGVISLNNGDFQNGGNVTNVEDVPDWFDSAVGAFFEQAWITSHVAPNGTNGVIFSSFESDDFGMPTSNVNDGAWIYQTIGIADGAPELEVGFDWGTPTDDGGGRNLGLTVGVYAYDGVGGFVGADGTDVRGGAGVTLLDSQSFEILSTTGGGQSISDMADLDISGAGSQELFLRINGYIAGSTEAWPWVDNVTVDAVPEPSIALLGGLGLFGLMRRRRS